MSRPLRIALPTSTFLPALGGVEVGLHNIALRLQSRGHHPVVMVPAPHHAQLQRGWSLPYDVIPFPPKIWGILRHYPFLGFAILDWWFERMRRKYSFDVWHCTMGWPTGVALVHYARTRRDVPHLVRCAGEDIQQQPEINYGARLDPVVDALVRQWLPQADCLVAITDTVADEYHRLGIPEARIARITNGVDLQRLGHRPNRIAARQRFGLAEDEAVFLSVGRNHPKKNFSMLLEAVALVKQRCRTPIRVIIAGRGASELQGRADALGLTREALLLEQIGDEAAGSAALALPSEALVALYHSADVFVLPSITETFGIVLVEAMAAGLPVVTTDAPGCRDIIRGGEDGVMVPPNDPDAMAEAMLKALVEPTRSRLSALSVARSQAFSWDDVVDSYLKLYYFIINTR
jgi:glycosyltransferase involved in cell wall biosynthesis